MKKLVSVRYAVEVEIPYSHTYATDDEYAEAVALRDVQDNAEWINLLAVEVVDTAD